MGARSHSRKKQQPSPGKKFLLPHKFTLNERVLAYEPDPKKARVLYDSKVIQLVERKDDKGKLRVEYKIHFFGWSSSWDRYVAEDCVLKDTEKNRELQRELKKKADALIESQPSSKKKKRKKTLTELLKGKIKDKTKSTKSDGKHDDDSDESGSSDSSDQESSDDENKEVSRIYLTDKVKALLEMDYHNISQRSLLVRIPAEVSVICVFEGYVKFIGFRELRRVVEHYKPYFVASGFLPSTSSSTSSKVTFEKNTSELLTENIESLYRKVRQAQEIVHGLKIIFDHMLYQMLLYNAENDQYKTHHTMRPKMPDFNCSQLIPQLFMPGASEEKPAVPPKKKQKKRKKTAEAGSSKQKKSEKTAEAGSSKQIKSIKIGEARSPQLIKIGQARSPQLIKSIKIGEAGSSKQKKSEKTVEAGSSKQIKSIKTGEAGSSKPKKSEKTAEAGSSKQKNKPVAGPSREINSETLNKLRKHTKGAADDPLKSSSSNLLSRAGYEGWLKTVNKYINELDSWQMLPEECYQKEHPDPSMVYGLIHLLRFFVKLPDILTLMHIPRRKIRIIAHHVNQMIDHVQASYVFSISRLYVSVPSVPRNVYEEDQIRVGTPASEEDKPEVIVDKDTDASWNQLSQVVVERVRPALPKVVEVPLSSTEASLEEHQLTIRIPVHTDQERPEKSKKKRNSSGKTITKTIENVPLLPANAIHVEDVVFEFKDFKQEPLSPALPTLVKSAKKHQITKGSTPSTSAAVPMARTVRKSAAHAAFKTAHMFASQQTLTSRTIAASNLTNIKVDLNDDDEPLTKKRCTTADEASTSHTEAKQSSRSTVLETTVSRTSSTPSSGSSKGRDKQEPIRSIKISGESAHRRISESPTRKSRDSKGSRTEDHGSNVRRQHSSSSKSPERKHTSPDKSKLQARRISSPRTSKAGSSTKDGKINPKSAQKSPTSTSIRLRSRSDERQLRSKGQLINALALPMQGTSRSSHAPRSEEDKSPRRRDSTGNRDHGSTSGNPGRHSEPVTRNRLPLEERYARAIINHAWKKRRPHRQTCLIQ